MESSFLDLLAQIAVGGGNDPHIHLDDGLSTEPLDLSPLESRAEDPPAC